MSKKKRTKKYQGEDAVDTKPHITRFVATPKSRQREWWDDHRLLVLGLGAQFGLVAVVGLLLFGLVSWIF